MFTGLVEMKGVVSKVESLDGLLRLTVEIPAQPTWNLELGESVAINGACMTVATFDGDAPVFDISKESQALTNLGRLKSHDQVNLERAMKLGDRLGGHMVSGHIDGLGTFLSKDESSSGCLLKVQIPKNLSPYIIKKGSICIDGVSLTINEIIDTDDASEIHLMLIPTTLQETTLGDLPNGWKINIEVDLVGKYIERMMQNR